MLNELHDLAQSLKAVKVSMTSWHQHFKTCPKGSATYYVLLDATGLVTDVEQSPIENEWGRCACGKSPPASRFRPSTY